jgi:hypothetical protein
MHRMPSTGLWAKFTFYSMYAQKRSRETTRVHTVLKGAVNFGARLLYEHTVQTMYEFSRGSRFRAATFLLALDDQCPITSGCMCTHRHTGDDNDRMRASHTRTAPAAINKVREVYCPWTAPPRLPSDTGSTPIVNSDIDSKPNLILNLVIVHCTRYTTAGR